MIYPKNNLFVVSTNPHSIGLQNNMTSKPTFGSTEFLHELASNKAGLVVGALKGTKGVGKCCGCNQTPGMPVKNYTSYR
jgi:hypothetical protein